MSFALSAAKRVPSAFSAIRSVLASRGYASEGGLPSINHVQMTAEVFADPQVRRFQNKDGTERTVSNLFVANTEDRVSKDGKSYIHRTYFKVRSFSPKINAIVDKEVTKGTFILIDGKIVRDSWENKEGNKVYETSIEIPEKGDLQILSQPQAQAR